MWDLNRSYLSRGECYNNVLHIWVNKYYKNFICNGSDFRELWEHFDTRNTFGEVWTSPIYLEVRTTMCYISGLTNTTKNSIRNSSSFKWWIESAAKMPPFTKESERSQALRKGLKTRQPQPLFFWVPISAQSNSAGRRLAAPARSREWRLRRRSACWPASTDWPTVWRGSLSSCLSSYRSSSSSLRTIQ